MAKVLEERRQEIVILDPTGEVEQKTFSRPSRLHSLMGKTLGLLSDGIHTSTPFLERLGELLLAKYQVKRVILKVKPNLSLPAPAEMLDELVVLADAIIIGVGL
ncbi:MAG: hypothetical protein HY347_12805 [candidate division NC10 bacterium]|nr:hypothetical protein [candidate division NC10 bacterium]